MNPDRKIYTVKENDENGYDLFFTNITNNIPALNIWEDEKLQHVTRVYIPNGVTTIEKNAFQYFENLKSIEIPNSVTHIGSCAFENCTSLSYVKMSDSIIHIGAYAFHNCKNLKNIYLPDTLCTLGNNAFKRCRSLTTINIPKTITDLEYCVFEECESLTNIELPETLTTIGRNAFKNCEALKIVKIPNRVQSIYENAFYNCIHLEQVIFSDNTCCNKIDSNAFTGCHHLKKITLPKNISTMGYGVFQLCYSLETITLPQNRTDLRLSRLRSFNMNINEKAKIIMDLPHIPYAEIQGPEFTIHKNFVHFHNQLFEHCEDITAIYDFLNNPTYEKLMTIKSVENKIPLAMAYYSYDPKFAKYIKTNQITAIRQSAVNKNHTILDFMMQNDLIGSRFASNCIDWLQDEGHTETMLEMMNYKNKIGGYGKPIKNRFAL